MPWRLCPDGAVDTEYWIAADKEHCWHPFTRQDEWVAGEPAEPLVLVAGEGVWLTDSEGRRYIDGNASIWTNVHGHNHPVIRKAIDEALDQGLSLSGHNPNEIKLADLLCA